MKNNPTTAIKFFNNGIRVNGSRELCKVFYSLDGRHDGKPCVMIYERSNNYNVRIPGDLFGVVNDSDIMTDYFEDDRAAVFADHPLYGFVRACAIRAWLKQEEPYVQKLRVELAQAEAGKKPSWSWRKPENIREELNNRERLINERCAELAALPQGQPTAADVAQAVAIVAEQREEARRAREAQEAAEQAAHEEEVAAQAEEAREAIERYSQQYPTTAGAPYVVIEWSEHPGLDEGLTLSVPAADRVLAQLDASRADRNQRENGGGYDKTSFTVYYLADNGEWDTYGGRYDLGDDDGGLIAHIRSFGEWLATAPAIYGEAEENRRSGNVIVALADRLDKLCTVLPGRVLSFSDALKRKQSETAAAGALAAELLLDLISAAAKAETPAKPEHREPGVIIPLF